MPADLMRPPTATPTLPTGSLSRAFELPSVIGAEVSRALSEDIIFLRIEPGSRLTEEDVCSRFGVSRSPVREALKMLEADGLIVRSARRGVKVTPMSRQDLEEVYACRAALEGAAAAGAAKWASPAARAEIARLVQRLEEALARKDVPTFFQNNVALTRTINGSCGNNTLIRVIDGIEKQAWRYRYLAHTRTVDMMDTSLSGLREVCEAILAGKGALAHKRVDRMIWRAFEVIARAVDETFPDTVLLDEAS